MTVTPLNDSAPVFTSSTTWSVAENTQAIHTLTATDADLPAQTLTFSIAGSGADNGLFEIVHGNRLQFVATPDFENPTDAGGTAGDNVYEVSMLAGRCRWRRDTANDSGIGDGCQRSAGIHFTNDGQCGRKHAGRSYLVRDRRGPASQTITFSLADGGADNGLFEIVSGNQLQFAAAPDFGESDGHRWCC